MTVSSSTDATGSVDMVDTSGTISSGRPKRKVTLPGRYKN